MVNTSREPKVIDFQDTNLRSPHGTNQSEMQQHIFYRFQRLFDENNGHLTIIFEDYLQFYVMDVNLDNVQHIYGTFNDTNFYVKVFSVMQPEERKIVSLRQLLLLFNLEQELQNDRIFLHRTVGNIRLNRQLFETVEMFNISEIPLNVDNTNIPN